MDKQQLREAVLNRIAISQQLLNTRRNQAIKQLGLSFTHFTFLNHFSKDPSRGRTITGIARAFQTPQPGVTKVAQKLQAQGLIEARVDPEDGRSKRLYLSAQGKKLHKQALAALAPDAEKVFAQWSEKDIAEIYRLITKLKDWLDEDRDPDNH